MTKWLCVFLVCATVRLLCQVPPSKPQVSTITAVHVHEKAAENSADVVQYDVSLKVSDTVYVVLYTPPSGSKGVEYAVGQNVVVLIGSTSITVTRLGRTSELPILSRETVPLQTGLDWSRAPSEYFSQKLQHLSEKLQLTADQQVKIKPILEQEAGEARYITANSVLSREDKVSELQRIVHSSDQKLKPILSLDQWRTLQNMRKDQKREIRKLIEAKPQTR